MSVLHPEILKIKDQKYIFTEKPLFLNNFQIYDEVCVTYLNGGENFIINTAHAKKITAYLIEINEI